LQVHPTASVSTSCFSHVTVGPEPSWQTTVDKTCTHMY
jgi:hypothetical protein